MSHAKEYASARRAIEQMGTWFNIYFFLSVALLCAVLLIREVVAERSLDQLSDSVVATAIGAIGVAGFFPVALVLYVARHSLTMAKQFEQQNEELRSEVAALKEHAAPVQ